MGVAATGCIASDDEPHISETASASTVQDYANSGCSTAVVIGLSQQIAQQANCDHPGNFVPFTATNGITITSNAVLPYLDKSARDDLQAVAANNPIQVNSALRTLAQQYLLVAWFNEGRCGITAAAPVGTSNHEGGRAVDLANYADRITAMANHGWAHDVPGDDVHFDHLASTDHRGEDVAGFQELWNLNNPADQIGVDGQYGPQTEARLQKSPATGFAMGPTCGGTTTETASVVSVDGPDMVPPQTQAHYTITLKNTGNVDWPATTKLQLAMEMSSPLHDASWMSDTVITTLGTKIAAGSTGMVDFDVTTPAETAQTPLTDHLELDDSGNTFGTFDFSLTVVPGMGGPTSGDGGDGNDGKASGGCNTGGAGGGGTLVLALGAVASLLRRRR